MTRSTSDLITAAIWNNNNGQGGNVDYFKDSPQVANIVVTAIASLLSINISGIFSAVGACNFNKSAVGDQVYFKVAGNEKAAMGVQNFGASPNSGAFGIKSQGTIELGTAGDNVRMIIGSAGGVTIGAAGGGDQGVGTLNVATDIYKNNSAYSNPKWVFTHHILGISDAPSGYLGLLDLEKHESIVKTQHDLPLMLLKPDGGIFERGDMMLASIEEAYLYIYELNTRLKILENAFVSAS